MAQQGFILPTPRFRAFTVNGLPANAYKVYFYAAGTSTPQNTYSDSNCTVANANPVILSASGEATIFLPAGLLYKVDLHDAGDVPVAGYPIDGVEATTAAPAAPAPPSPVPTGAVLDWSVGGAAPSGFLLCDGSAVSRATYSALNALYAAATPPYPFGNGNGSTTFNVPDYRQRVALGQSASGTGAVLGETGGAIDHTHTGPSHTHGVTVTRDGWGNALNNPSITSRLNVGNAAGTGNLTGSYQPAADLTVTSAAGGTGATGGANMAYLACPKIVKT